MVRLASTLVALLVVPVAAAAQHEQHAAAQQLGSVSFQTSCSPAVAADFNRAVALLHSFEFRDALATFNTVLEKDPSCAVAHWGAALCQWGNPFAGIKSGPLLERGAAAAQQGLTLGKATPRERAYVAAAAELFKNAGNVSHRDRTVAYARAMEGVQRDFPDDIGHASSTRWR
jgi:hypothetical protein